MASNAQRAFKHPIAGAAAGAEIKDFTDIRKFWQPESNTTTVPWRGGYLQVKKLLSMREVSALVNRVMDMCFDDEREIAIPEAADFAIRMNVLIAYAGITPDGELEEQYRTVYESGLYDAVCREINRDQLDAIRQTVQTCVLHMM